MNGTIIDIQGINVNVIPVEMQDSTDRAYVIVLHDGVNEVTINIVYGKITQTICSSK